MPTLQPDSPIDDALVFLEKYESQLKNYMQDDQCEPILW